MYQIDGRDELFNWLERETDARRRQVMLDWLVEFAEDPTAGAQRIPGTRAPIFLVLPPVDGVTLTFLLAEQFNTVKLLRFGTLP